MLINLTKTNKMVTLTTASNALKSVYLGVVANQLNVSANPIMNRIKQSESDVWGKEIIKLAPYGLNGGVSAGAEDGILPVSGENKYVQFKTTLKNLFGTIELSDKSIRASQSNAGAFVNLLNAEMEGLLKASTFNLGRMFYGNGSGVLAHYLSTNTLGTTCVLLNTVRNITEGMITEIVSSSSGQYVTNNNRRVVAVDRINNTMTIPNCNTFSPSNTDYLVVVQKSFNKELTGIEALFDSNITSLYGLAKSEYPWLSGQEKTSVGLITDEKIQEMIDKLDEYYDSKIDFISCSSDTKRYYQTYLNSFRRNIDYMELQGGYKAMSYGGVPIVSSRFIEPGTMYLLNTADFTMHQLCDWQWLEGDDGNVIKQKAGYPTYTATLVKYAEMICDKPAGQAVLRGINSGTVDTTPVFSPTINVDCNCADDTATVCTCTEGNCTCEAGCTCGCEVCTNCTNI